MQQTNLYDIIIVGASKDGLKLAELLSGQPVKVALVSKTFNQIPKKHSILDNIIKITGEVVYSSYYHGLITFTLANGQKVVGQSAVIATGTKPTKPSYFSEKLKNLPLCTKPVEALVHAKNNQIVVYGNTVEAIKYAIQLSKHFRYIYLCSEAFNLAGSDSLHKKLAGNTNIVHLPGCKIMSYKADKNNNLREVTLDTYSVIHCAAVVLACGRTPDSTGISDKMVELNSVGAIITDKFNRTTKVPNIYAIGECSTHSSKQSIMTVKNMLLKNKEE